MKELAELLTAIAALLWQIIASVVVFHFKSEIKRLLHRLKKGKILGQEIELEEQVRELNDQTIGLSASLEVPKALEIPETGAKLDWSSAGTSYSLIDSPRAALIELSARLEMALKVKAGSLDHHPPISIVRGFRLLHDEGQIPFEAIRAAVLFVHIRNNLVHTLDVSD
jgi:hypothetical protein